MIVDCPKGTRSEAAQSGLPSDQETQVSPEGCSQTVSPGLLVWPLDVTEGACPVICTAWLLGWDSDTQ